MENNSTIFGSLLNGGRGTWKEVSQKGQNILEHDVTNTTGDALLDRLMFLSDHMVSGKVFFKIKVGPKFKDSNPIAELSEFEEKKTKNWSKELRKVLIDFSEYFNNFLCQPLLNHLLVDDVKNMAAVSLLFEIAKVSADSSNVNRNDVARAINVGLSSSEDDAEDLANFFVKEKKEKTTAFIKIMNRNNETKYLTSKLFYSNDTTQGLMEEQPPKKKIKTEIKPVKSKQLASNGRPPFAKNHPVEPFDSSIGKNQKTTGKKRKLAQRRKKADFCSCRIL